MKHQLRGAVYILAHPTLDQGVVDPADWPKIATERWEQLQHFSPDPKSFLLDAFVKCGKFQPNLLTTRSVKHLVL